MPALLLALLAATITKVTDFVRFAKAKDVWSVVTQLVAWGAGIGGAFLLVHQNLVSHMTVQGFAVDRANGAALVLLGLMLGSGGSIVSDFLKAVDTPNPTTPPRLGP